MSLAAYALQLADHPLKDEVLKKLIEKSYINDDVKYWSKSAPTARDFSKTLNVEITAYGLMALIEANKITEGFPFYKWLLNQRNSQGGFEGTQDTVVGLQALAKFTEKLSINENRLEVTVEANDKIHNILLKPDNSIELQKVEVRDRTGKYSVNELI